MNSEATATAFFRAVPVTSAGFTEKFLFLISKKTEKPLDETSPAALLF